MNSGASLPWTESCLRPLKAVCHIMLYVNYVSLFKKSHVALSKSVPLSSHL